MRRDIGGEAEEARVGVETTMGLLREPSQCSVIIASTQKPATIFNLFIKDRSGLKF